MNLDDAEVFVPWSNLTLRKYDPVYADLTYYSFPKEQWIALLDALHPTLIASIGEWKENISDCDNFSQHAYYFVSKSFINAGYPCQGAFMVVWSRSHAYNAFVDTEGKIWIYEPQNNKIIGDIEGTLDDVYNPDKVWFPGEVKLLTK